ncbi:MAG: type VI secretion system tip protein VgrG [Polyangiaceae bacterium]|nr:type VI secretion system tip protein VgrG [Polyangiaceae bacterium]
MPILELTFASGESSLSVRQFAVRESISAMFDVFVIARSTNPSVNIAALVGQPATFRMGSSYVHARRGGTRAWAGIVSYVEQVQATLIPGGAEELSTYAIRIVPTLWLLTQRTNHRIFQHMTIPDIVGKMLAEWGIRATWRVDRNIYPKLEYKVQHGESDYNFICRLLEEAGISFLFQDEDDAGSVLTFDDRPEAGPLRDSPPVPYVDTPNKSSEQEFVTAVELVYEVRPGAATIRDYDFRNPAFPLFAEAPKAEGSEARYEQYHYRAGSMLVEVGRTGSTPVADDLGYARHFQKTGEERADLYLHGERQGRRAVSFHTNVADLWPGVIFAISRHPHPDITEDKRLLLVDHSLSGSPEGEWVMSAKAVFAEVRYEPVQRTPKPRIRGVQTATVVGPQGDEIHTDEFGRVRVQFPWDREGTFDEKSSCWIRVSQEWSGAGYGFAALPRVGQEVLVTFLGGDPDMPIIIGRAYNAVEPVPYKLPENKTQSVWRSESSPGGGGFNEIIFEDKKADELFYMQAEKNERTLVKNDETITVVRDRRKHVEVHEHDLTVINRTQVTGVNRVEVTGAYNTLLVGKDERTRIKGESKRRLEMNRFIHIAGDKHFVVKGTERELIEDDVHLSVDGDVRQHVMGNQSLTVQGNWYEKVGDSHALETGKQAHFKAGTALTGEAAKDVTVKGPGGFLRIDASGVIISGTAVKINAGGRAGKGNGSNPELPELPEQARVDEPELPDLPEVREVPPVEIPKDKRAILSLSWNKSRVDVGKKAFATFYVSGFMGGEEATVKVFEVSGGERKLIETIMTRIDRPRGRMKAPFTRGGKDAESDLQKDTGSAKDVPLEYRFEVDVGEVKGEGDSGPLWLTKTIVVDLMEHVLKGEGLGKEEKQAPDGTKVIVTGGDGTHHAAITEKGIARVKGVVVGKQIAVRVDKPSVSGEE